MNIDKLLETIKLVGDNSYMEIANKGSDLRPIIFLKGKKYADQFVDLRTNIFESTDLAKNVRVCKEAGICPISKVLTKNVYYATAFCKLVTDMIDVNNLRHKENPQYSDKDILDEIIKTLKTDRDNNGLRELIFRLDLGVNLETILEYKASKEFFNKFSPDEILSAIKFTAKKIKVKKVKTLNK